MTTEVDHTGGNFCYLWQANIAYFLGELYINYHMCHSTSLLGIEGWQKLVHLRELLEPTSVRHNQEIAHFIRYLGNNFTGSRGNCEASEKPNTPPTAMRKVWNMQSAEWQELFMRNKIKGGAHFTDCCGTLTVERRDRPNHTSIPQWLSLQDMFNTYVQLHAYT